MARQAVDQAFREHEGDDYVLFVDRSSSMPQDGRTAWPLADTAVASAASVAQWVVVVVGSTLIAWLAQ